MVKSRRSTSWRGSVSNCDVLGVAAVAIGVVAAEGGHLDLAAVAADQHHAEVRAHQPGVGEQLAGSAPGGASVATS